MLSSALVPTPGKDTPLGAQLTANQDLRTPYTLRPTRRQSMHSVETRVKAMSTTLLLQVRIVKEFTA